MEKLSLEKKYVLEYIKDLLNSMKLDLININNADYHHNSEYRYAASICKYGILSIQDLNKLGLRNYSDELLFILSDEDAHVNGIDKVSLSKIGLEDMYGSEFEYTPESAIDMVDFIVSNDITTYRSTNHFGNEFLSSSISNDKLKSVDVRLLKLIECYETNPKYCSIESIISRYNYFIKASEEILQLRLDIQMREMSKDGFSIDINKLSQTPKLKLKK